MSTAATRANPASLQGTKTQNQARVLSSLARRKDGASVPELAEALSLPQHRVYSALRPLVNSGRVLREQNRSGRIAFYRLNPEPPEPKRCPGPTALSHVLDGRDKHWEPTREEAAEEAAKIRAGWSEEWLNRQERRYSPVIGIDRGYHAQQVGGISFLSRKAQPERLPTSAPHPGPGRPGERHEALPADEQDRLRAVTRGYVREWRRIRRTQLAGMGES